MPGYLRIPFIEEDRGYKTPCLIWQGASRRGYGMKTNPYYNGSGAKMIQAHVYYYVLKYGPVPQGKILNHLCRVRLCVNPDHVEPATHKENIREGNVPIIDLNIAENIRKDVNSGMSQSDAAKLYKISQSTISQIMRGVTWK